MSVSPEAWAAAREQMRIKEKALTGAKDDALAAERRRMPWQAVETAYAFEGLQGKASLLDLLAGRRQLIVYRAFFEPGVYGGPDHPGVGCSMVADQVAHIAHSNARGDEAMGGAWDYLDITPLGREETWEDSPEGNPQEPPYKWWKWRDTYAADAAPDPGFGKVVDAAISSTGTGKAP